MKREMGTGLITRRRQDAKVSGLLGGAVGEEVGGDAFEGVSCGSPHVFVWIVKHRFDGWGCEARVAFKGAQRTEGKKDNSLADIVEKVGEGWNHGGGLYVEIAKCVCSALTNKVIGAFQVTKENREGRSGISPQFRDRQGCAGADAIMAIGQGIHQRRERRRADVAKGGAREEPDHLIGTSEHLGELWNRRRTDRTKHLEGIRRRLLGVQIVLGEHLEQVRDAVGSNRAQGLLGAEVRSAPRLGVLVGFEPGAQRLFSVAGFGGFRGQGERPSQNAQVAEKKDERPVPHVGSMPRVR